MNMEMRLFMFWCTVFTFLPFLSGGSDVTKIIGIFSNCWNKETTHPTSRMYSQLARVVHGMDHRTTPCNRRICLRQHVIYEPYDVCDDAQRVVDIATQVALDVRYFEDNDNAPSTTHTPKTNVRLIVTYLSQQLQELLCSLMYFKDAGNNFLIISLNTAAKTTPVLAQSRCIMTHDAMQQNLNTVNIYRHIFNWNRIGVINLDKPKSPAVYNDMYSMILESLKGRQPPPCYFKHTVNITDGEGEIEKTAQSLLKSDRKDSGILLYGTPASQLQFLRMVLDTAPGMQRIWLTHDLSKREVKKLSAGLKIINLKSWERNYIMRLGSWLIWKKYNSRALIGLVRLQAFFLDATTASTNFKKNNPGNSRITNPISQTEFYVNRASTLYNFQDDILNDASVTNNFGSINCDKITCAPGWEPSKMRLESQQQTKWSEEYGWTCTECQYDHTKELPGTHPCTPCLLPYHVANSNRTLCVDPYQLKTFGIKDVPFLLYSLTTGIGILIVLSTAAVFYRHKQTPIVKSSDTVMTSMHLTVSLSLFVTMASTYPDQSDGACVVKVYGTCVFYTLIVSVAFMKSHTLLRAFEANTKITSKQRIVTRMQQVFPIFILLATHVAIVSIALLNKKAHRRTARDVENLLMYEYCDTHMHISVQAVCFIILQLVSVVMAFRGRNLPDVYNQAMSLFYASFITTISFGVMLAIVPFQKNPLVRTNTQLIVLNVNNILYLLFCYVGKLHFVLFKKTKNNEAYFQKKTFEMMRRKAAKPKY